MEKQQIFVKTSVQDELPEKCPTMPIYSIDVSIYCSDSIWHIGYYDFNRKGWYVGSLKKQVQFWLKPVTAYVHSEEEINTLLENAFNKGAKAQYNYEREDCGYTQFDEDRKIYIQSLLK